MQIGKPCAESNKPILYLILWPRVCNISAPHPLGCMFVYMRHGHRARLVCRDRPVGRRRTGGAHQQPGRLCGHRGGGRHGAGGHPGPGHGQSLQLRRCRASVPNPPPKSRRQRPGPIQLPARRQRPAQRDRKSVV